jgi:hypothetical protein
MNINQQEQQALFTSKLIEGKDEVVAKDEILRDLKFIKDFNQLKRDKTKEIRELEQTKAKLLNQIEKSRQALLKLDIAISQPRIRSKTMNFGCNGLRQYANTIILTRMLRYLESNPSNLKELERLSDRLCISKFQAEDALLFINKWIR